MDDRFARVRAQAKVNLFLRIGDRQPDGYHNIETLFQRIELSDDVQLRATDDPSRSLVCRGFDAGPVERNLAFKAASSFASRTGWPRGFEIQIEKKIPVGGGLGGGSADAAAVLRLLNHLAPEPLDRDELMRMALKLGADVPFLLTDSCLSFATGRGEVLTPIKPLPVRGLTLFMMPFSVSTADAYRWLDEDRQSQVAPKARAPREPPIVDTWADVTLLAENDFEQVIGDRHPALDILLTQARTAQYEMAEMTGSGSTVFGVSFDDAPAVAPEHVSSGMEQVLTTTVSSVAQITH